MSIETESRSVSARGSGRGGHGEFLLKGRGFLWGMIKIF